MKVLYFKYDDGSGFKIVRAYYKEDYEQAEKDLELLQNYASECKIWYLEEVEEFNKKENE